jgi:hypothetical protein
MKKRVPYRNRSPYGWWVASILTRYEEEGEDTTKMSRVCQAWEDTILIEADDREEAYRKAVYEGKQRESESFDCTDPKTGKRGRWVFAGLVSLLPVYEELKDGAEIIWNEHRRSAKTLESWVKSKGELEAFIDEED